MAACRCFSGAAKKTRAIVRLCTRACENSPENIMGWEGICIFSRRDRDNGITMVSLMRSHGLNGINVNSLPLLIVRTLKATCVLSLYCALKRFKMNNIYGEIIYRTMFYFHSNF